MADAMMSGIPFLKRKVDVSLYSYCPRLVEATTESTIFDLLGPTLILPTGER